MTAGAPTTQSAPADVLSAGDAGGMPRATAPRARRRRRMGAYALAVTLGLTLIALLALTAQRPGEPLDPQSPRPNGARALVEVLREQGVDVEVVRSVADLEALSPDADTTVVMSNPANLGPGATSRLRKATTTAGRLVLLGVDNDHLDEFGLPVRAFGGSAGDLVARCSSSIARDSDVVSVTESRYLVEDGASGVRTCFALPDPESLTGEPAPGGVYGSGMVELGGTATAPDVVLVGFGSSWSNEYIAENSNAGTAVRALGSSPRLVWYHPGAQDLALAGGERPEDVWPAWTGSALAIVSVAILALALVRGRRLGRLVREPLPVVVRAIETTESRGRLYRRAGDPGRAAAVLRAATAERLGRRLAVSPGAGPAGLVPAVAVATGRPTDEVAGILFGPAPRDDAALIHLAQQLTDLEERAHHP